MSEKECMPGFTVPNETLHKKIQEVRTQLYRMRLAHPDQNIAEKVNELMKAREVLIRLMGIMSINVEKRLFGINWYPLAALIGWLEGTGIKWKIDHKDPISSSSSNLSQPHLPQSPSPDLGQ